MTGLPTRERSEPAIGAAERPILVREKIDGSTGD
jgi:hypothetical protein